MSTTIESKVVTIAKKQMPMKKIIYAILLVSMGLVLAGCADNTRRKDRNPDGPGDMSIDTGTDTAHMEKGRGSND